MVVRLRLRRQLLLGKKCYALRIASVIARDEEWLAEHMLLMKLTSPEERSYYLAAAFPSACGKTNLAMLRPTLPGWTAETLGDDIVWMRFGADGRLYATNPEYGLFGVAPGTSWRTNPNAMATIDRGNSIFTNVALTDDGDVVGRHDRPTTCASHRLARQELDAREATGPAAPNSRFCTPLTQCPIPRPSTATRPESRSTPSLRRASGGHGATGDPGSELAARGLHGCHAVQRDHRSRDRSRRCDDPMAMLPFLGYAAGDYRALASSWRRAPSRNADDLLRELVPQAGRWGVPLAGLR